MSKKTYILTVEDFSGFDPISVNCAASENKELIENLKNSLNEFFNTLPADHGADIRANTFLNEPTYRAQLVEFVQRVINSAEIAEELSTKLCEICDIGHIFVYADNFAIHEVMSL